MAQHSKAYRQVAEKIDKDSLYAPLAATTLAKESGSAKYDSTVDVSMRLGVDPRKADQMVRGTVNLPHGTGKTARVLVFAVAEKADAAREAGDELCASSSWPGARLKPATAASGLSRGRSGKSVQCSPPSCVRATVTLPWGRPSRISASHALGDCTSSVGCNM